jgi:protein gp37
VFDNHRSIHPEWRRDLWQMIEDTPHLDWQLLTKRPQNFAKLAPARWIHDGCPANLWIGTTVENQTEANRRIPHLLEIPSRVRFLSCEPLLGPVDLTSIDTGSGWVDALQSYIKYPTITPGVFRHEPIDWPSLDWVIAGGESGPQARPTNPQWLRDLRDQCAGADVPFLFKQWGEWVSVSEVEGPGVHHKFDDGRTVRRTGKKRAGRLLDGVLHDAFPTEIET